MRLGANLNKDERLVVRFFIALFGVFLGYVIQQKAYAYFIETGVTPDVAVGGSIAIFALVLGAFGLIAVKVSL